MTLMREMRKKRGLVMSVGYAIEAPSFPELEAAHRKVNRLLQRAESDMNVGLALINDQKTFESDLETLLETLKDYTECRIHEMRRFEPPLTDIRFEMRISNKQSAFEGISNMIVRLIQDVQALYRHDCRLHADGGSCSL